MQTVMAVGELVQAAAHQFGVIGPVEFTVCRPRDDLEDDSDDDDEADFFLN